MLGTGLEGSSSTVENALAAQFGGASFVHQDCADGTPTVWTEANRLLDVLQALKPDYPLLYDLFAIDERLRERREGQPAADFTVVYHLMSLEPFGQCRVKVPVIEPAGVPTAISVWPNANWYEREAWDMFGIRFDGHPNLRRILCPPTWEGHPLRFSSTGKWWSTRYRTSATTTAAPRKWANARPGTPTSPIRIASTTWAG